MSPIKDNKIAWKWDEIVRLLKLLIHHLSIMQVCDKKQKLFNFLYSSVNVKYNSINIKINTVKYQVEQVGPTIKLYSVYEQELH